MHTLHVIQPTLLCVYRENTSVYRELEYSADLQKRKKAGFFPIKKISRNTQYILKFDISSTVCGILDLATSPDYDYPKQSS